MSIEQLVRITDERYEILFEALSKDGGTEEYLWTLHQACKVEAAGSTIEQMRRDMYDLGVGVSHGEVLIPLIVNTARQLSDELGVPAHHIRKYIEILITLGDVK